MQFLMNDLSIHGQFNSAQEFAVSVDTLMEIRQAIRRVGRELFCHRDVANSQVTSDHTMPQAIQALPPTKRLAWIQWLTRVGPYWVDDREHTEDDWLEVEREEIVTNQAVGEAAFCLLHGLNRQLVSITPSGWLRDPIKVVWRRDGDADLSVEVTNHWSQDSVSRTLEKLPSPYQSWRSLEQHVRRSCEKLSFGDDAFAPLEGQPYSQGVAERIEIRLNVLNTMRGSFDEDGNRTPEGDRLYSDHFTGKKAWFTDSTDGEKVEFESEMTFSHPERAGGYLLCSWHGKVKTPQMRIHFSWPIAADVPLYVLYVGPKITKR